MILDESISALDSTTEHKILGNLKSIQKDTGLILIIISHNLNVLRDLHKVYLFWNGYIISSRIHKTLVCRSYECRKLRGSQNVYQLEKIEKNITKSLTNFCGDDTLYT